MFLFSLFFQLVTRQVAMDTDFSVSRLVARQVAMDVDFSTGCEVTYVGAVIAVLYVSGSS